MNSQPTCKHIAKLHKANAQANVKPHLFYKERYLAIGTKAKYVNFT